MRRLKADGRLNSHQKDEPKVTQDVPLEVCEPKLVQLSIVQRKVVDRLNRVNRLISSENR